MFELSVRNVICRKLNVILNDKGFNGKEEIKCHSGEQKSYILGAL
jgi:hypothetical protein